MRYATGMRRAAAPIVAGFVALSVGATANASVSARQTTASVTVTLTDSKLALSRTGLPAGSATFLVANKGQKVHVFSIEGPGIKGARIQTLQAGKTISLTMPLKTGAYMLTDRIAKGPPLTRWIVVSPATVVKSTGNASVTVPLTVTTGMNCD
jgi:Cupredoxin-like domain